MRLCPVTLFPMWFGAFALLLSLFDDVPEQAAFCVCEIDEFVLEEPLDWFGANDFAIEQHRNRVGRCEREIQIVRHQDDGVAFVGQGLDWLRQRGA